MKSKSIKGRTNEEIRIAFEQSLSGENGEIFKPTLAIIFLSKVQDHAAITKIFDDAGVAVFGVTTNGEFTDENTTNSSVVVLLMDMNPEYFAILSDEYPDKKYRDRSRALGKKALERFKNPSFILAFSNIETDAEDLLLGFEDTVGKDVNVYGGGAGDDYSFTEQVVFTNSWESKIGMLVLVFDDDKIKMKGRATCGWNAVGTVRTVTKSEGNHVYTVDDIPVLDLTAKYGGMENVSPDNKNLILEIASTFPLQMQRDKGDPVMRPGLKIDWADRSFYCSGTVPQGCKVRFSLPPDFDVVEKVITNCTNLKETEMNEADAVIVFSCAGRQVALGPMIQEEMGGLHNIWNVPMVGMFSNAELGRSVGGYLEMHNLTTCVIALKEK